MLLVYLIPMFGPIFTCTRNVYAFKTRDGTCLAVADAANVDLRPASNNKTKPDAPEEKWIWKRLFVVGSGEVRELLRLSTSETFTFVVYTRSQYYWHPLLLMDFNWLLKKRALKSERM